MSFNAPFEHFRFKEMPFGINSAPMVSQRVISQVFEALQGVILDNVLLWLRVLKELCERLGKVLQRVKERYVACIRLPRVNNWSSRSSFYWM